MACASAHVQVMNGFLAKADAKDKLTGLLQYACLFLSAGEAGNLKKVQASITVARKVFRVMRPLELISPLLIQPVFTGKQPVVLEAINKLKTLCMALYFGADHLVWAQQLGLVDKKTGDKFSTLSLAGWAYGSVLAAIAEIYQISNLHVKREEGESEEAFAKRVEVAKAAMNKHCFALFSAAIQTLLAFSVKGSIKLRPRTLGLVGVISQSLGCWSLIPAYPKK
uniref:Peroxisomal membrane protein 11C n=1 Tax=Polytomella parva TaxID=51329 RepID=A0A7S0US10_9CHLO|eukprot:CAMPEP_0175052026 /NCGR_PEP_ID=MMETSP0052_2-20121109/8134_1 /TAXON_ID=51329 ORGANISM="Polytomella parva, Strain SAG 63-3" /NCGR_SAMPLE_ID=MMETSP0052_2 /ASSEMBLY_ACC=CAM_ASM_000194 /LENGTH=223 /DNA_ID=CAMNT_0016316391 /DNA_START=34 /DNA_END=705 /DNA_ORIENTATION=+